MLKYQKDNKSGKHKITLTFFQKNINFIIVAIAVISGIIATIVIFQGKDNDSSVIVAPEVQLEACDTIYIAMYEPKSFNVLSSDDEDVYYINDLVYGSLFKLDDTLNIQEDMVLSYSTDSDNGVVTVTIRDDVYFSDGSVVDAYDIQDTVEHIQNVGASSPYYHYVSKIENVVIDEKKTATIYFKSPSDASLDNLTFPLISVSEYDESQQFAIGSGPYSYGEYVKGQGIQLLPNEYYHQGVSDTTVEISFLKDKGRIPGLMSMDGVIGYLNRSASSDLIAEDKGFNCLSMPSSELEFIGFNLNSPLVKEVQFRKAISMAIDFEKILSEDYGGSATISDSIYYPGFLSADVQDGISYEPKEATENLSELGLSDSDGDGFIENQQGDKVTLDLIVKSNNTRRTEAAQSIADELVSVGIEVNVIKLSNDEYNERLSKGNFDMYFAGLKVDKQFNLAELFGTSNYINLRDESLLSSIKELEKTHTHDEQIEIFKGIKSMLNENMVYMPVCYINYYFLSLQTLEYEINPAYYNPYRGLYTWKWQKRVFREEND